MAGSSTANLVGSTLRAAAGIRDLQMRKAMLGGRLQTMPPTDAARLVQSLLERAGGSDAARDALMGMAAWQVDLRHAGELTVLRAIRDVALEIGAPAVAAIFDDAPAHRQLALHGRLREIGMAERMQLSPLTSARVGPFDRLRFLERARAHPSPVMIQRLLAHRAVTPRDALLVAARRPTSAAIAYQVALQARWMASTRHREALAMNPFTPTGLSLALLPTLRAPVIVRLRDAGDVHAALARAAGLLLELQRCTRPATADADGVPR